MHTDKLYATMPDISVEKWSAIWRPVSTCLRPMDLEPKTLKFVPDSSLSFRCHSPSWPNRLCLDCRVKNPPDRPEFTHVFRQTLGSSQIIPALVKLTGFQIQGVS